MAPENALAQHVEKEDTLKQGTPTTSGIQLMLFINESGLYSHILSSKLESAIAGHNHSSVRLFISNYLYLSLIISNYTSARRMSYLCDRNREDTHALIRSPLTAPRSPLITHRSPLTSHLSPLTAHPLTVNHSLLITRCP